MRVVRLSTEERYEEKFFDVEKCIRIITNSSENRLKNLHDKITSRS